MTFDLSNVPFALADGKVDEGVYDVRSLILVFGNSTSNLDAGNYSARNFPLHESFNSSNSIPGFDTFAPSTSFGSACIDLGADTETYVPNGVFVGSGLTLLNL